MSIAHPPVPEWTSAEEPRRHRWTRAEFHRMAETGILDPDARLELIDGEIFEMSPIGPPHTAAVLKVERALERAFGDGFHVRGQSPAAVSDYSEPVPDVAVVEGEIEDYDEEHPTSAVLIVEVSDSTLTSDRGRKAGLYASRGVPEYWIVNLQVGQLEVRRDPAPMEEEPFGWGYRALTLHRRGDSVTCLAKPGAVIQVDDLLPRPKKGANP
jgi:Uma2 family endonuclease